MEQLQSTLEVKNYTGILSAMDETGDSRIQWDRADPAQVAKARSKFDELRKKGYAAYSVTGSGKRGTVLKDFDENAERIIMHAPMVGG